MSKKLLMKGNEAIAEAAMRAECKFYFGYPITPQTEIAHYLAKKMDKIGSTFLQAESETSAINMVYGASAAGARVMTSSSSPGISLKAEGISYLAGADLPAVIINIMRCGPGLGGILAAQGDYFQAVKGGGHGDYKLFVLAPNSVQEMYELTVHAFNVADKYRVTSMVVGDGLLGQMMEVVEFKDKEEILNVDKSWSATGSKNEREPNIITSINLDPEVLETQVQNRTKRYKEIEENEIMVEEINCDDADIIIVAYGTMSRIVQSIIEDTEKDGIKIGLIRPITLWPFPKEAFTRYNPKCYLSVEMSTGQMVEDVRLAVNGKVPVYFYGRQGGIIPFKDDIFNEIKKILKKD